MLFMTLREVTRPGRFISFQPLWGRAKLRNGHLSPMRGLFSAETLRRSCDRSNKPIGGEMRGLGRISRQICALGVRNWAFAKAEGWVRWACAPRWAVGEADRIARRANE